MKVLFVLDHAPDYRESFLHVLGEHVDLTVVAQPCEPDGLMPPNMRNGYEYIEIKGKKFSGLVWQKGLNWTLHSRPWDVVCFALNLRQVSRIALFLMDKRYRDRWVWWGHIFGQNSSRLLDSLRRLLLSSGVGCLTYSEEIAEEVRARYGANATSFNNTQVREDDFRVGQFCEHPEIRLLFVGRFQARKRLERLVELAVRRSDVFIRLVGPGMDELRVPDNLFNSERMEIFPRTVGEDLNPHFDWADLVANPGHVGLIVMNTAQHGKGIVIDSDSLHAPEYWLAKEAEQPFIPFGDHSVVDRFVDEIKQNRKQLQDFGDRLQAIARQKYTIEAMVSTHLSKFEEIVNIKANDM